MASLSAVSSEADKKKKNDMVSSFVRYGFSIFKGSEDDNELVEDLRTYKGGRIRTKVFQGFKNSVLEFKNIFFPAFLSKKPLDSKFESFAKLFRNALETFDLPDWSTISDEDVESATSTWWSRFHPFWSLSKFQQIISAETVPPKVSELLYFIAFKRIGEYALKVIAGNKQDILATLQNFSDNANKLVQKLCVVPQKPTQSQALQAIDKCKTGTSCDNENPLVSVSVAAVSQPTLVTAEQPLQEQRRAARIVTSSLATAKPVVEVLDEEEAKEKEALPLRPSGDINVLQTEPLLPGSSVLSASDDRPVDKNTDERVTRFAQSASTMDETQTTTTTSLVDGSSNVKIDFSENPKIVFAPPRLAATVDLGTIDLGIHGDVYICGFDKKYVHKWILLPSCLQKFAYDTIFKNETVLRQKHSEISKAKLNARKLFLST